MIFYFRFVTLCYATLTETTCMLITIRTFFASTKSILPFKVWIPYKITSSLRYWSTFFHQTIAHVTAANLQIANETLICGFMIHACLQLELLKNRLREIPKSIQNIDNNYYNIESVDKTKNSSKNLLVKCIKHHQLINEYVTIFSNNA